MHFFAKFSIFLLDFRFFRLIGGIFEGQFDWAWLWVFDWAWLGGHFLGQPAPLWGGVRIAPPPIGGPLQGPPMGVPVPHCTRGQVPQGPYKSGPVGPCPRPALWAGEVQARDRQGNGRPKGLPLVDRLLDFCAQARAFGPVMDRRDGPSRPYSDRAGMAG